MINFKQDHISLNAYVEPFKLQIMEIVCKDQGMYGNAGECFTSMNTFGRVEAIKTPFSEFSRVTC